MGRLYIEIVIAIILCCISRYKTQYVSIYTHNYSHELWRVLSRVDVVPFVYISSLWLLTVLTATLGEDTHTIVRRRGTWGKCVPPPFRSLYKVKNISNHGYIRSNSMICYVWNKTLEHGWNCTRFVACSATYKQYIGHTMNTVHTLGYTVPQLYLNFNCAQYS